MTITPDSVREMLGSEDYGKRLSALNQMRQLDPTIALEFAQIAAQDVNARVRYGAVSQMATLGEHDRPAALETLRNCLLTDREMDVRAAAADALSALQLTEAFEDMVQVYNEIPDWLLRFSIVAALGAMGDARAFELLQEALKSDQDLIKTAAIGALGELGDRRAIPLLLPYATDPDWQIRHRIAQALGYLNGEETRATLEQLAQDETEVVAQTAQMSLTG